MRKAHVALWRSMILCPVVVVVCVSSVGIGGAVIFVLLFLVAGGALELILGGTISRLSRLLVGPSSRHSWLPGRSLDGA